ncbi:MAG: UDP-3-O-(3-hydroxymyristoyl)glucosamine N-acyltransferase [Planctomycetes bacterium]|nr:UDP-3-O-(3-hydroxymyristoyl)glucosamine N-acyltransferase [Planctomycetota bacterium]MCB9905752.1 UDP-3-O-(3-hydroxymyristoyl)glucosamine N-acyltransferase [Planctomycetota bacterium]
MSNRTLSSLAELCGATLEGDGALLVRGPAALDEAQPDQISFLNDARHAAKLADTRAGAVIVPEGLDVERSDLALLRTAQPNAAFSAVVLAFAGEFEGPGPEPGVHPSAVVHRTAELAANASVGPFCVIGAEARIADGCVLHERVSVQARCTVGADSVLHAGVVLRPNTHLGARCVLHAGVVLGADGFGYDPVPPQGWQKVPQCGGVRVGDDVEIGANTCVDRGRFGDTRIGDGVKIDNQVQIGHNCDIGAHSLLCAQVGVSGSTTLEPWVVAGGKVSFAGHIRVGQGARLGGAAGAFHDLAGGQEYMGLPARPRGEYLRQVTLVGRLPELKRAVRALEQRIAALEGEDS